MSQFSTVLALKYAWCSQVRELPEKTPTGRILVLAAGRGIKDSFLKVTLNLAVCHRAIFTTTSYHI